MKTSHIMCTSKILRDLCYTKQRIRTRKSFAKVVCSILVVQNVLTEHKGACLSINGTQSVKLDKGTTCVDDKFVKPIVVCRSKHVAYKFIEAILEAYEYCQKVMKKHLNKNLVMTKDEEKQFQSSKIYWIS